MLIEFNDASVHPMHIQHITKSLREAPMQSDGPDVCAVITMADGTTFTTGDVDGYRQIVRLWKRALRAYLPISTAE